MPGFQFYDVALTPSEIVQEMGLGVAAGGGVWWGALDLIAAGAAGAAAIVAWRWPEARPLPRILGVRRTWCGDPWLACTPGATCFAARCIRSGTNPAGPGPTLVAGRATLKSRIFALVSIFPARPDGPPRCGI